MREVDAELGLEDKIPVQVHLSEHRREHLIFLESDRVVLKPLKRVLYLTFQSTVVDGRHAEIGVTNAYAPSSACMIS